MKTLLEPTCEINLRYVYDFISSKAEMPQNHTLNGHSETHYQMANGKGRENKKKHRCKPTKGQNSSKK